jgi:hypothetical protein
MHLKQTATAIALDFGLVMSAHTTATGIRSLRLCNKP